MYRLFSLFLLLLVALPLQAQERNGFFFADDAYLSGRSVANTGEDIDDLFAMGDRVTAQGAISGSAYLMGRKVNVSGPVGVNLYAGGSDVTISAPIAGDAMLMGQEINIGGPVGGDLRAAGAEVNLAAPVAGAALIGADTFYLNAEVEGDIGIAASSIEFGPDARVLGMLHLYGDDPGAVEVPQAVAPSERVVWHQSDEWGGVLGNRGERSAGFWTGLRNFAGTVLVAGLLATVLAAIAPDFIAAIRRRGLESPLRSTWLGFLALSAAFGSVVVFALSGFGLILVPVSVVVTIALWMLGYIVGVYILGVGISGFLGRARPEDLTGRAIAAMIGALAAALIGLVPFVGWFFLLALALFGAGGVMVRWFAPGFYTEIR